MAPSLILLHLKVSQLANSYRNSVSAALGDGLVLLIGLWTMLGVGFVFWEAGGEEQALGDSSIFVVLFGSVLAFMWLVAPFVVTSSLMDVRQFIPYPIDGSHLVRGLLLATLITPGALITGVYLLLHAGLFRQSGWGLIVILVGAPLVLIYLNLLHQVSAVVMAAWLGSRQLRTVLGLTLLFALMVAPPIALFLREVINDVEQLIENVSSWLSFSPLGAGFSLPYDIVSGDWAMAGLRVLVLVATAGIGAAIIQRGLRRMMENPGGQRVAGSALNRGDVGLFAYVGSSPTSAVAARSLTFWLKDPRYAFKLMMLPLVIMGTVALSLMADLSWPMYVLGPYTAFLMGFVLIGDVSMDYTGFALHVTSGVSGAADRWGRTIASLVLGVPLVLATAMIPVYGAVGLLPAMANGGMSLGLYLAILGISAFFSVRAVIPMVKPGDSPMKATPGGAGRAALVQGLSLLFVLLLCLPSIVLLVAWTITGAVSLVVLATAFLVVGGAVALVIGHWAGAREYERRLPELYQTVVNF